MARYPTSMGTIQVQVHPVEFDLTGNGDGFIGRQVEVQGNYGGDLGRALNVSPDLAVLAYGVCR